MGNILGSRLRVILLATAVVFGLAAWLVRGWLISTVLPNVLRTQLTTALGREVAFSGVDTNLFSYFSVSNLVVAKDINVKEGSAVSVKKLVVKYELRRLILKPTEWTRAVKRIELVGPRIELAMEELFPPAPAGKSGRKEQPAAPSSLPPLPKTYMMVKDGNIVLTRRGAPVLEIKNFGGNLDLRDLPLVQGLVRFAIMPDAAIMAEGRVHLGLRYFDGTLSLEGLNLGQMSDLARLMDPTLTERVGGRLKAKLEVKGGFMTLDELVDKSSGRGSLEIEEGSFALAGSSLVSDMYAVGILDERRIALERLSAKMLSGSLDAVGSIDNLWMGRLRLKGRLDRVPVQAIRPLSPGIPADLAGLLNFEFSATGTGRAPVFRGTLTSPVFGLPGVRGENLVAEAEYTIDAVRLTNLSVRLWGGSFTGGGRLSKLDKRVPELNVTVKGSGFDVAQSPLGKDGWFAGTAELSASMTGPVNALTGDARARVAEVRAKGVPVGNLAVSARFEGSRVSLDAKTDNRSVVAVGDIVFDADTRFSGWRVSVQERLPVILALAGISAPKDFEGRASGKILLDGPVSDPVVTIEAFASGVRFGKVVIGDQIRIPRFVYENGALVVPASSPVELAWLSENTRVTAYGNVPVGAFSATGQREMKFHFECSRGSMAVLKRLDLVKDVDGEMTAVLDVGGTASYPVWSWTLSGEGRKLVLFQKVFGAPMTSWRFDSRVLDSEGVARAEVCLARQRQAVDGRLAIAGWKIATADVATWTEAESGKERDLEGLPLLIADTADIRVKLAARLLKSGDDSSVLVTGREEGTPAELTLSDGVIMYAGGDANEEAAEEKAGESLGPGVAGPVVAVEAVKTPSWATKNLNFQGRVAFGRNLRYRPRTWSEKGLANIAKAMKTEKKERKKIYKSYLSTGGVTGIFKDFSVGFDIKVSEGSALLVEKAGENISASGKIEIDEGGVLALVLPKMTPPFFESHEFTVVKPTGKTNTIEFEGEGELRAKVSLIGETILFDKTLLTEQGEKAAVDELKLRMVLRPPSPREEDEDRQAIESGKMEKSFLYYKFDLKSDPEEVSGEVEVAGGGATTPAAAGGQAASGTADSAQSAPTGAAAPAPVAAAATGTATTGDKAAPGAAVTPVIAAAPAAPITRTVSIKTTTPMLFMALTGQQDLAAALAGGNLGDTVSSSVGGAILSYPLSYAVKGVKWALDLVGLRPDVAVRKSDVGRRRQAAAAASAQAGGTGGPSAGQQIVASALDNTEMTIGKKIARNFYVNMHMILLDSSAFLTRASTTNAAEAKSNPYGFITDLTYRREGLKGEVKARWFGLPDDPRPEAQREFYVGGSVNQSFKGVGQRDKFVW